MFSFIDRQILVLLVEPIKADLQINDTQVSLLTGFAFAITYTVMGIPLGRVADVWSRKYVIVSSVTVWSLLTIASAFTRSFTQLFVTRMGVGFGEAGLTAPAYTIVADLFPPGRLAFAMSVFVLGGAVGSALSLMLGGLVIGFADSLGTVNVPFFGSIAPWRLVLIIAGGTSLLVVVPLLLVPEAKRHHPEHVHPDSSHSAAQPDHMPFKGVLRYMQRKKMFYGLFIAATSFNYLITYGSAVWFPSYFIRVLGWEAATIGITVGLVGFVPLAVGGLFSGWLTDRLFAKGHRDISIRIMMIAGPVLLLLNFVIIYAPLIQIKLMAVALVYFFGAMYAVLTPTAIQLATPSPIRSQVSAIILFIMNLVGLGLGPTVIALVTDYIFRDSMAVGHSIAVVGTAAYLISTAIFLWTLKPFSHQVITIVDEQSRETLVEM
ncbi:hypothetical protein CRD36_06595 [Paremcibacter congregatus]|uniref:Major facilitator superfamily (MFS) profile domain-containing protein n=2 Tax=Paremcibacter congregatus TaxID=2043170 RepID=A0A2G4YT29_9PROT|nr:hypothetical protein CRD36_06595 [Paremcibacter congregatus]